MPELTLPGISGGSLTTADLAGQVTILHFWEYRDQPLKEPYGQVGYLEFLFQSARRRGSKSMAWPSMHASTTRTSAAASLPASAN